MHLIETNHCIWVQVDEDDWAADQDLAKTGTWGEAPQLPHSLAGSVMSDVEGAPVQVVSVQRGDSMDPRLHGVGDEITLCRTVNVLPARVFLRGQQE